MCFAIMNMNIAGNQGLRILLKVQRSNSFTLTLDERGNDGGNSRLAVGFNAAVLAF